MGSEVPFAEPHIASCCSCYSQKSKSQAWKSLIAAFFLYCYGAEREKEESEGKGGRKREGEGEGVAQHLLLGVPSLPPPGSRKGLGLGGSRPGALPSRRAQASPSDLRRRANPASGAHSGGLSGPSASSGRPAPHTPAPGPSLAGPRGGGTDGGGDWAAPRRVPVSRESARRGECLRGAGRRGLGPPLCAAAPGPHALRRRVQGGGNSATLSRRAPAP